MQKIDEQALFDITLGLYIVGAYEKDSLRPVGCLADAVVQISAKPVTIAVSLDKSVYTHKCIAETGEFSLSILAKDTPDELMNLFGFKSGKDINKWQGLDFIQQGKLPLLTDCLSRIVCKVISKADGGDHTIFIGEVTAAEVVKKADPITYADYRKKMKGAADWGCEKQDKANTTGKWVCSVCGYVYDGDTPFEELPEDWICPCCKVGKKFFKLQ